MDFFNAQVDGYSVSGRLPRTRPILTSGVKWGRADKFTIKLISEM